MLWSFRADGLPLTIMKLLAALATAALALSGPTAYVLEESTPLALDGSISLALDGPLNGPVEIYDDYDLIPYNQEWVITQLTYDIQFPEEVKRLAYVVFMDNESDLSRTIATTYPAELLSEDGKQFAPGTLIIAIGVNPKSKGIYCSPEVCEALGLNDSSHLAGARSAMDVHTSQNRYDRALLDAARAAADPEAAKDHVPMWLKISMGWFIAMCVIAALWGVTRLLRNRQHSTAADIRWLKKNVPSIALGFKQVDLQAEALRSPLASTQLHKQWDSISKEMKEIASLVGALPDPKELGKSENRDTMEQGVSVMRNNVEGFQTACSNIEYLYALENGDPNARENELTWLSRDMRHTRSATRDNALTLLIEGAQNLAPADPNFIHALCDLYTEYIPFTDQLMSIKNLDKRRLPAVWDFDWHPCYSFCELQTFESLH